MNGTNNFIKPQLIPQIAVQNVYASLGGAAVISSGVKLLLPSSEIADKKNETPYNGKVNAYMAWIVPIQNIISYQM